MPNVLTTSLLTNLPTLLSYPTILDITNCPEIHGQFVYGIRAYSEYGIAILIYRHDEKVVIKIGDFNGNVIQQGHEYYSKTNYFMEKYANKFVALMSHIGLKQAIFYLSDGDRLVDVRLSLNKFVGPGMIKDVFEKLIETQEIIKIFKFDDIVNKKAEKHEGIFSKPIFLKTSYFKTLQREKNLYPLYAKII